MGTERATAEYKGYWLSEIRVLPSGGVGYHTDDVCAFTKNYGAEQVLVLVNMRDSVVDFAVTPELTATPWDDVFNDGSLTLTPKITLKPYDYMVLRKLTTLN